MQLLFLGTDLFEAFGFMLAMLAVLSVLYVVGIIGTAIFEWFRPPSEHRRWMREWSKRH